MFHAQSWRGCFGNTVTSPTASFVFRMLEIDENTAADGLEKSAEGEGSARGGYGLDAL